MNETVRRWVVNCVVMALGGVVGVMVGTNLTTMEGAESVDGVYSVDRVDAAGMAHVVSGLDVVDSVEIENVLDEMRGGEEMEGYEGLIAVMMDNGELDWAKEKRPWYAQRLRAGEAPPEAEFFAQVEIVGTRLRDGYLEVERRAYGLDGPHLVVKWGKARMAWKTVYVSKEGAVVCLGHLVGTWHDEQRIPERVVWPGEYDGENLATEGTEGE